MHPRINCLKYSVDMEGLIPSTTVTMFHCNHYLFVFSHYRISSLLEKTEIISMQERLSGAMRSFQVIVIKISNLTQNHHCCHFSEIHSQKPVVQTSLLWNCLL